MGLGYQDPLSIRLKGKSSEVFIICSKESKVSGLHIPVGSHLLNYGSLGTLDPNPTSGCIRFDMCYTRDHIGEAP